MRDRCDDRPVRYQTILAPPGEQGIPGEMGPPGPPGTVGGNAIVPYSSGGALTLVVDASLTSSLPIPSAGSLPPRLVNGYSFSLPRAGTPLNLSAAFVATSATYLGAGGYVRLTLYLRAPGAAAFGISLPQFVPSGYASSGNLTFDDPQTLPADTQIALAVYLETGSISPAVVSLVGTLAAGLSIA
jgi:hypothetical protein